MKPIARRAVQTLLLLVVWGLVLVACSNPSDQAGAGGPYSPPSDRTAMPTASPTAESRSPTPAPVALPRASGEGFCTDRNVIADAIALIERHRESAHQLFVYVRAAAEIVRGDAPLAPTGPAASKIRQLAVEVHTLALAVKGAAANYPIDFSVRAYSRIIPFRVRKVSAVNGCSGA